MFLIRMDVGVEEIPVYFMALLPEDLYGVDCAGSAADVK
jgi:hypothetical protein